MGNIGSHVDLTSWAQRHQANTEQAGAFPSELVRQPIAPAIPQRGTGGGRRSSRLAWVASGLIRRTVFFENEDLLPSHNLPALGRIEAQPLASQNPSGGAEILFVDLA